MRRVSHTAVLSFWSPLTSEYDGELPTPSHDSDDRMIGMPHICRTANLLS